MDVLAAYREVGSYRGAAAICGTTHKTVRRIVAAHLAGGQRRERAARPRNYDAVAEVVRDTVAKTAGRISAKRLLTEARAAGYQGRRATSADWSPRRRRTGGGPGPAAGSVVPGRDADRRLGRAGRAARVLRGAGLVEVPVRALRRR